MFMQDESRSVLGATTLSPLQRMDRRYNVPHIKQNSLRAYIEPLLAAVYVNICTEVTFLTSLAGFSGTWHAPRQAVSEFHHEILLSTSSKRVIKTQVR